MTDYFIMDDDQRPVPVDSVNTWAKWVKTADREIVRDEFSDRTDAGRIVIVSTTFVGIEDEGRRPPFVYQTAVTGGREDGFCERYATVEQAREGHRCVVAGVILAQSHRR